MNKYIIYSEKKNKSDYNPTPIILITLHKLGCPKWLFVLWFAGPQLLILIEILHWTLYGQYTCRMKIQAQSKNKKSFLHTLVYIALQFCILQESKSMITSDLLFWPRGVCVACYVVAISEYPSHSEYCWQLLEA